MDTIDLIAKIIKAKSVVEVFNDLNNWKIEYKNFAKKLHPDVCNINGAKDAIIKLNLYSEELSRGKIHYDDAGEVNYIINNVNIKGNKNTLKYSLDMFHKIKDLKVDHRYLPVSADISDVDDYNNAILKLKLKLRSLPLSSISNTQGALSQNHVNWILSRMLEYCAYSYDKGFIHGGINPDSVYIEPINHSINIISFYHSTEVNKKLSTASGKYLFMYPEHIKRDKIATGDIDVELCKRTAVYLLGDRSGIGTSLRKTHSIPFLDFISKRHKNSIEAFIDYRKMIDANFEKKFTNLII